MIRKQDLVNEIKDLFEQLSVIHRDTDNDNIQTPSQLQQKLLQSCQTVIQHHEEWMRSIRFDSEEKEHYEKEQSLKNALQQIRIQLLLQQEHEHAYTQILKYTSEQTSSSSLSLSYNIKVLRAYALYQLQQYEQVLELLNDEYYDDNQKNKKKDQEAKQNKNNDNIDEDSIHSKVLSNYSYAAWHLQAQSFYHLQDMDSALVLYQNMLDDHDDHYEPEDIAEIYVNYVAAFLNQFSLPYCGQGDNDDDEYMKEIMTFLKQQQQQLPAGKGKEDSQKDTMDETLHDLRYNIATWQLLHNVNARDAKQFLQSHRLKDNNCFNQYEWYQHYWQGNMKGMRFQTTDMAKNIQTTNDPWRLLQYYHENYETLEDWPVNKKNIKWSLLQDRLFEYNRCVALLHQKEYDACRSAIQELWESMAPEKVPDKDDPAANDPVLLWWEVRLAVLLLYCDAYQSENQKKKATDRTTHQKKKPMVSCLELRSVRALEFALMSLSASPFRDHTLVYLQLHQAARERNDQQPNLQELFSDWPPSLRTKPAVQATLVAHEESAKTKETPFEKPSSKSVSKETSLFQGHWYFNQRNYAAAVECYENALSETTDSESKQIIQARIVQALTHVDPEKAMKSWNDMAVRPVIPKENYDYDIHTMEALEKNPPRWMNGAVSKNVLTESNDVAGTDINATSSTKKSRDAVLKQRARRRDRHLEQLQAKGLYNPERPTQPDPERWIPKYDRAANRRRKKNHVSSQNKHQGTGKISEKDLAKLDVAARQLQPKHLSSGTPSTAHMSASSSGRNGKRR